MRIYVAGPMRNIPYWNHFAFDDAQKALVEQGHEVITPAQRDREAGVDLHRYLASTDWSVFPKQVTEEDAIEQNHADVTWCDAVYLLYGWQKSRGTHREIKFAKDKNKIIIYGPEDMYLLEPKTTSDKPTNPKDMIGSDKIPLHLLPTTARAMGSLAMLNGLCKYGRSNFRHTGIRASIYYDAASRHLDAWFEGEECDPVDAVPHLSAALACIAIIVDAEAAGKLHDDRMYPGGYR